MLVKIIGLFLLAMAVLAVFGRLRFPRRMPRSGARRCTDCGRPLLGKGPCDCRKGRPT